MDTAFAETLDKAAVKRLSRRSDARGLVQLAGHVAALAAGAVAVAAAAGGPWLVPAWIAHGVVLVFLFAPLHETIHRTAFHTRAVNDALAWACGLVLLLPPTYFRAFHFAHHRHTQDPARDPELISPKPSTVPAYTWQMSGLPFWHERCATLIRHAAGRVREDFILPRQRATIVREARLFLAVYAAVLFGSVLFGAWAALHYWVVPALLGMPALRLFLLAEHTGCPQVPDMLRNSRTTRSNALVRALAWNMPFHVEHHAYPALPFHTLPAAHAQIEDRIAVQASGYIAVHGEILRELVRAQPETAAP